MQWIDGIVLGLIETYNTNNPYELCDLLGITINKVNSGSMLLAGNNSLYVRDYFKQEMIFIRDDLNIHHEEFYLRHELGHAILHVNMANSGICNMGKLEKQANYFAFKLSSIDLDEIVLYEMTLEQIASCLELPKKALYQLAFV